MARASDFILNDNGQSETFGARDSCTLGMNSRWREIFRTVLANSPGACAGFRWIRAARPRHDLCDSSGYDAERIAFGLAELGSDAGGIIRSDVW